MRPSLTTASPAVTAARTRQTSKNPNDAIRIHHGPVVTATITNMAPPEVMKHVKQVLDGMGVEIQLESEFKYRCVRMKRRKGAVASFDDDPVSPSSPVSESLGLPPIYGDPLQDPGDEVRFFVELTRLDGLDDTYSLDIRRLRGNLRSYKFLHDVMRE
ncbi:hypothetical protein PLEOSDRAFT_1048391 [Pleurotus ostreatus PC15]|uniref:non-specific serine/threonine protein kinase n=1 Tax=Pleurotus ostreatus (strain PC15) TaxID=1137138 RepID=A0A067NI36_PLEO1|nr:hypothetical protein PLEOSDRAFT_1048391 [Pleurotus ostreatus PC15]